MTHIPLRAATQADSQAISELAVSAFGLEEGPDIAQLIANLLVDASAQPVISLVATDNETIIGHVLFSKIRLEPPDQAVAAAILAPLAVSPAFQSQGIGRQLVEEGFKRLSALGVGLVFVLGDPGYYSRFGFSAAGARGFEAPYPIPQKNAEAWRVRELRLGVMARSSGRVICANALADPKYWRE